LPGRSSCHETRFQLVCQEVFPVVDPGLLLAVISTAYARQRQRTSLYRRVTKPKPGQRRPTHYHTSAQQFVVVIVVVVVVVVGAAAVNVVVVVGLVVVTHGRPAVGEVQCAVAASTSGYDEL